MPTPRVLAGVVTSAAVLALATACSTPPGPQDQRSDLLAVAEHVETDLVDLYGLADVRVIDDGAEPVPCPGGGERYRRLTIGTVDFADHVVMDPTANLVDVRLDLVDGAIGGSVAGNPVARDYFDRGWSERTDEPRPRQTMHYSEDGPGRGAWLAADLVPFEDESVLVRLEASTACG